VATNGVDQSAITGTNELPVGPSLQFDAHASVGWATQTVRIELGRSWASGLPARTATTPRRR
jgi:hypothetical protein